jgi:hypothetical protein
VTFLLIRPPSNIALVIKSFSDTQAEIITLCHVIIQVNLILVALNDASVEVIHG